MYKDLSHEEIEMLDKCVVRIHKEHGTLQAAKGYIMRHRSCRKSDSKVLSSLVASVWNVFKVISIDKYDTTDELNISCCIYHLELIDYLIATGNSKLISLADSVLNGEVEYLGFILSGKKDNFINKKLLQEAYDAIEKYRIKIRNVQEKC